MRSKEQRMIDALMISIGCMEIVVSCITFLSGDIYNGMFYFIAALFIILVAKLPWGDDENAS